MEKLRQPSRSLQYYRALKRRKRLTDQEWKSHYALEKGYQGELQYDEKVDDILCKLFRIKDVYLKIDSSVTQYDSIIVSDDEVIVHEIKNFYGQCTYSNERWYMQSIERGDDPLSQLTRAQGKLTKLKNATGITQNITGKIIFINVDFELYSDDERMSDRVVLRSQLVRYLESLQDLRASSVASNTLDKIESFQVDDPYFNLCADENHIKRGIYCRGCGTFDVMKQRFHVKCTSCYKKESLVMIVLQAVCDFTALFRNYKMTTLAIYNLLDGLISKKVIRKVLSHYCIGYGSDKNRHYELQYASYDDAKNSGSQSWRYS